jgi:hypothetical protein
MVGVLHLLMPKLFFVNKQMLYVRGKIQETYVFAVHSAG